MADLVIVELEDTPEDRRVYRKQVEQALQTSECAKRERGLENNCDGVGGAKRPRAAAEWEVPAGCQSVATMQMGPLRFGPGEIKQMVSIAEAVMNGVDSPRPSKKLTATSKAAPSTGIVRASDKYVSVKESHLRILKDHLDRTHFTIQSMVQMCQHTANRCTEEQGVINGARAMINTLTESFE